MGRIDIGQEVERLHQEAERLHQEAFKNIQTIEKEIAEHHRSPPGSLGLPPLLEKKRQSENVPDFIFRIGSPVYDRVFVFQTDKEDETYGDGMIAKPKYVQIRDSQQSARGIIISAGLQALDALRSNGIDIGHTVYISRMSTYSIPAGYVLGKEFRVLLLHAGEICASEDLLQALNSGACKIEVRDVTHGGVTQKEHFYVDENGQVWNPVNPNFTEDY